MRRLDFKIFLWFWLGVIVVSATLVTLTELTHSRAQDDASWRSKYGPRVDLWARQETHILRTQGATALETYVGSFQSDPGVRNYIFDGNGHEVLGRQASGKVRRMVASMGSFARWSQNIDPNERIIAEKAVDALGNPYVVVVDFPGPSILNRSLSEFLTEDPESGGLNSTSIGRLAAVLIVAGVFCFMLARHIARPIERLRAAAGKIANQQLETRVDGRVLNRRDELADLGRDFDRMAERIETLVTAQRRLLADVSHALRSPLARLNVALGLARRHGDPATAMHLDRIEGETERLNTLIGQLLTMARVEGGVDLERQSVFDLGHVVAEVAADADYEARNRHCMVRFDQRCECTVAGAREMLRGAVENVVRNAVRHTADHTTVEVSMDYRHDAGRPRAVIEVRDHGPGVPGDGLANLFTPFQRVANGDADTSNRTGLGLAITRRAFEVHGGTATAANAPGGGFVVTLEMPLRLADSSVSAPRADDPEAASVA